jgi:signal transduction histidine kinase
MWNCERLNKFINDIIDVTRMNAGKLDLSPQTLDILALVQEILAALRPLAEELKISFVIDINPPLPKVYGDRELLGRALKDIICNAMKFTPAGKAVLITAKKDNETTIVMQIRDAGPGLSAEQITQVFEKFSPFAAPPQTSKKIKGTGLGLFLAKRIVEMHHGKIWAESAHETGTTVSVAIPRNNVR